MTASNGLGRKRDPSVDHRVLAAAIELYGEVGWAGFSVDAATKRAAVGKASIYLRWPTREALLIDALGQLRLIEFTDNADLRSDLVSLTRQLLELYVGPAGRAVMRIGVEAESIPAVDARWQALRESQVLAARTIVRHAIARGELQPDTSVTILLDLLCGAATMHVMATPAHRRQQLRETVAGYAEELVDFLLAAELR
jgi:AcrR family transcriptional regulator